MEPRLERVVSRWQIVALSVNDVVGSGVYLLPAAAFAVLGVASVWAVLAAGVAVSLVVLCFAEAASLFETSGSAYVYTRAAFGRFVGFEVGWMTWLARVASAATLSAGFAQAAGFLWPGARDGAGGLALIVVPLLGLTVLQLLGIKQGARAAVLFTLLKLVPLALFVAAGARAVSLSRLGDASVPSLTGLGQTALLLLFAYAGFENTPAAAAEFEAPRRNVPFALLTMIGVVTAIYVSVQLVAIAVVPDLSGSQTPLADGGRVLLGPVGGVVMTVGAAISILGTNSNTMLAGPRYLYALAEAGTLPRFVGEIHPRWHTPYAAILIQAGIALPLALSGTFAELATLSVMARLATYIGTAASVPVLRRKLAASERTVRIPGGPLVPALAVAMCVALLSTATWKNLVAAAAALVVGAIVYAACTRRRGR